MFVGYEKVLLYFLIVIEFKYRQNEKIPRTLNRKMKNFGMNEHFSGHF